MISEAQISDAVELCAVAAAAFASEDYYRPVTAQVNGPPGHDEVSSHKKLIKDLYYIKYEGEGHILGGCVADIQHSMAEIHTLFVAPAAMNRGIGKALVNYLIQHHPKITTWSLSTPDYAARNHSFYESIGFECTERLPAAPDIGFGFFQYTMSMNERYT